MRAGHGNGETTTARRQKQYGNSYFTALKHFQMCGDQGGSLGSVRKSDREKSVISRLPRTMPVVFGQAVKGALGHSAPWSSWDINLVTIENNRIQPGARGRGGGGLKSLRWRRR